MDIQDNLKRIQRTINDCNSRHLVQLIAVTKARSSAEIKQAILAGQVHFGENYVQEALVKIHALSSYPNIIWHFIGPIQSNKTAAIAQHFHWVHSIDRLKIATRLNEHRARTTLGVLNVCIQVNIDNEPTKSGVLINELDQLIPALRQLKNLSLKGLMCIPSINSTDAFAKMAALKTHYQLPELSMGMSNDMEQAIENGATMVRVGRAIFT